MNSDVAHQRIRNALRAELKSRHGQIGKIEAELNRSGGYLGRFCRGDMEIGLKALLEVLELLQIDAGQFFATTTGNGRCEDAVFRRAEADGPFHAGLAALERCIDGVRDVATTDVARQHRVDVDAFLQLPLTRQVRRLRTSKKYRSADFVEALLQRLDDLRYEDPSRAARLVVTVAEFVLPETAADATARARLVCTAFAIYSASIRLVGETRTAARAIRLGLSVARSAGLDIAVVDLLERGAYALGALGDFDDALFVTREALALSVELDDPILIGRVLVCRGIFFSRSDRIRESLRSFERGLRTLPHRPEAARWRFAAYQNLGLLESGRGEYQRALAWMASADQAFRGEGGLLAAKLLWQRGSMEMVYGDLDTAESCLRDARREFEIRSSPDLVVVSLDLLKVLVMGGRLGEARALAKEMASLVGAFERNKILEATLLEFLRIVLRGELSVALVDRYRTRLEKIGSRQA